MKTERVSITMNDKQLIERLVARYKQNQKVLKQLNCMFGHSDDSPVLKAIWETFYELTDMVAEKLYDTDGWIGWFIWENDCGAKSLSANGRSIKTVSDLLWVIRGGKL